MNEIRTDILNGQDHYGVDDALASKTMGKHKLNRVQWSPVLQGWMNITGLYNRKYVEELNWNTPDTYSMNLKYSDSLKYNGYWYKLQIPQSYNHHRTEGYPLVVYLHGGLDFELENEDSGYWYGNLMSQNADEQIIFVAPTKNDVDWQSEKVMDVCIDVMKKCNVDANRIYLTGLSMGGRGTILVCSELPDVFAAIAVLSPHHYPTDYTLAYIQSSIPVLLHHSENDSVSDYSKAIEMRNIFENQNNNLLWIGGMLGHSGWESILYGNESNVNWLLSHSKT